MSRKTPRGEDASETATVRQRRVNPWALRDAQRPLSSSSNTRLQYISPDGLQPSLTAGPAEKRLSAPPCSGSPCSGSPAASSDLKGKVALRQVVAERTAIERQGGAKGVKPPIPPKPVYKYDTCPRNASERNSDLQNKSHSLHDYIRSSPQQPEISIAVTSPAGPPTADRPPGDPLVTRLSRGTSISLDELRQSSARAYVELFWPMFTRCVAAVSSSIYSNVKLLLEAAPGGIVRTYRECLTKIGCLLAKPTSVTSSCPLLQDNVSLWSRRAFSHTHKFVSVRIAQPICCDLCGDILWGRCTRVSQCVYCKYSCHEDCESLIVKECSGARAALTEEDDSCLEAGPDVDDRDSGYSGSGGTAGFTLTKEEICSRIKAYNERKGSAAVAMTLPTHERDTFQGCIQVCICIDRPISMSLSSRPTSIYDVMHRNEELSPTQSPENTMSPVLLPRDSVMSLHINSANTSSEVVGILLNKFRITDNPKGFALFEQTIENDKEVKLRKIADQEKPLVNFLRWSTENISETKRFVLKENDSGEIMWEAFSIPELHNFLRMLEAEELEYHQQIKSKYNGRKKQMELQLSEHFCERPCQQL